MISDLLDFLVVANPYDSSAEAIDDLEQNKSEGWLIKKGFVELGFAFTVPVLKAKIYEQVNILYP